jgi:SWI/SNF-related matrix-associated actin-dependent regulator 1 of chromatin subfamily A
MKLYPFQEEGAKFLAEHSACLLADEQGLGKTLQAIRAFNELGALKVLVVCPASVKYNWRREIEKWSKDWHNIQVLEGRFARIHSWADVVIVNYDLLLSPSIKEQILKSKFAVGVFDEFHLCKSPGAQRTKAVLLRGGVASRCVFKWFLTGTPVLNRPVELYPLLKAAAPELIRPHHSYNAFGKQWCGGHYRQNGFGGEWWDKGATNIDELNGKLTRSGFMLRRLKSEVLDELPEKTYQILPLSTAGLGKSRFLTWDKSDARRVNLSKLEPGELARFRHDLALAKLPTVIAHIKDTLETKSKLVVFAYHRDVLERLVSEFRSSNPVLVYGGITALERDREVARFQSDPDCHIFFGQITAAGVGITLTAADTAVFAEISWTPGEIFQACDRIHRIGQKNAVLIQFLVFENTLEEFILRTVIDKKETIHQIVERQGEVSAPIAHT